jgi:putative AlgH/UPF0301 family transcriptional regulator
LESAVLALGYAGWQAGQLESEIQANGWLHCPADPADPVVDQQGRLLDVEVGRVQHEAPARLDRTAHQHRAIADGRGPESAVLALGYAGWQAGQLESEIQANG